MPRKRIKKTGSIHLQMDTTIWWEPRSPNVINVCTGDPTFVNDEGGKPGLWLKVRRCPEDRKDWNRMARALDDAGELAPPLMP